MFGKPTGPSGKKEKLRRAVIEKSLSCAASIRGEITLSAVLSRPQKIQARKRVLGNGNS